MSSVLQIEITQDGVVVRTETFDQDVIKVGRSSSSHLCLEDANVSRSHAMFERSPSGDFCVIDLGSGTGTHVNQQEVARADISSGDEIRFGDTTIRVEIGQALAVEAPAAGPELAAPPRESASVIVAASARVDSLADSGLVHCAWCHHRTVPTSCSQCGRTPLLDERWLLTDLLGHGANGHTWKAQEAGSTRTVAIKELSFRRLTEFKQLDLFQREAEVLRALDHPSVPRYFEDFCIEDDRHVSFYLVQELVGGEPLQLSPRWSEERVRDFLSQMAEVLAYLAARRPGVVHRDIKPTNVMWDGERFVLIDFGSTRSAAGQTVGGSTVAGTLGYMAPEQLRGLATTGSDIYGLAATAVALLCGKDASVAVDPHRPGGWHRHVQASSDLVELLDDMLRADPQERLGDPMAVQRRLKKPVAPRPSAMDLVVRPKTELAPRRERESGAIRRHLIAQSRDPKLHLFPWLGLTLLVTVVIPMGLMSAALPTYDPRWGFVVWLVAHPTSLLLGYLMDRGRI